MARYIDANALIKSNGSYDPVKWTHEYGKVVKLDDIENAPTADARPNVRGEWIRKAEWLWQGYECSSCGYEIASRTNFCPNCGAEMLSGADMRGENK